MILQEPDLCRRDIEQIAAIWMGHHYRGQAVGFQLCADAGYVNRNTVGLRLVFDAPHIAQQFLPRHTPAGLFGQTPQQFELAGVEGEPAVIDAAVPVKQIERKISCHAKSRDHCIMLWKKVSGQPRCHKFPPARIE